MSAVRQTTAQEKDSVHESLMDLMQKFAALGIDYTRAKTALRAIAAGVENPKEFASETLRAMEDPADGDQP